MTFEFAHLELDHEGRLPGEEGYEGEKSCFMTIVNHFDGRLVEVSCRVDEFEWCTSPDYFYHGQFNRKVFSEILPDFNQAVPNYHADKSHTR